MLMRIANFHHDVLVLNFIHNDGILLQGSALLHSAQEVFNHLNASFERLEADLRKKFTACHPKNVEIKPVTMDSVTTF